MPHLLKEGRLNQVANGLEKILSLLQINYRQCETVEIHERGMPDNQLYTKTDSENN